MEHKEIEIPVRVNSTDFQEFALFDTMHRQGCWKRPVVFSAILIVSACICFALNNGENQGGLLGWVLLIVGVGLPLTYFLHFFRSVRIQAKKMGLDQKRHVYTVRLTGEGVNCRPAVEDAEAVVTSWDQVAGAWRQPDAVYLYVQTYRAYILPNGQANVSDDELWAALGNYLPADRLHEKK